MTTKKSKEQKNMEWQDLSQAAKNVLENCWLSVFTDRPTSGRFEVGQPVYKGQDVLTNEVIMEMLEYQKENLHFNIKIKDNHVFVQGAYREGEWEKFDNALTKMGERELGKGMYLYKVSSDNVKLLQKVEVVRETKTQVILEDFTKLKKTEKGSPIIVPSKYHGYVNHFYLRETVELKKRYERQELEIDFESYLDMEEVTNDQLIRMIKILKEGEE